jgi:DNA polymerase
MDRVATIDFETRSFADLKRVGAYAYSVHPTTEVLCMAWAIEDDEVELWTPGDAKPTELLLHISNDRLVEAHNAFFERCIWENIVEPSMGWNHVFPKQWRCSAAKAAALAMPRDLDRAASAMGIDERKDKEGNKIMMKLCKPFKDAFREGTPEELDRLYEYCRQDVRTERALSRALPDLPPQEQKIWFMDQAVNARGAAVDLPMLEGALIASEDAKIRLNSELAVATEGEISKATQRAAVLAWVNGHEAMDPPMANTQGTTVDRVLEEQDGVPDNVRKVLGLVRAVNRTSTAKYRAIKERITSDGRIRDLLMYHGASTGRWTGKGFQPHNLPRGSLKDWDGAALDIAEGDAEWLRVLHGDEMELLSHAIRGTLVAPPGRDFVVSDFSAVEARGLLWLADDQHGLDVFRAGEDIYVDMAQDIYKVRNRKDVTKDQRFIGKQAILGLGYGMGPPKFQVNCKKYKVSITEEFSKKTVSTYREKYKSVKDYWDDLNAAAMDAVTTPGRPVRVRGVTFGVAGGFLKCRLPSGRKLHYCKPKIMMLLTPWGERRPGLAFLGMNSMTNQWGAQSTYGGKLAENVTQAVARDLLAEALLRVEATDTYDVVLHVHDEVVAEADEDKGSMEELDALVSELPTWAEGCPIAAEGWRGKRYKK